MLRVRGGEMGCKCCAVTSWLSSITSSLVEYRVAVTLRGPLDEIYKFSRA